jgi:hypothetical protein
MNHVREGIENPQLRKLPLGSLPHGDVDPNYVPGLKQMAHDWLGVTPAPYVPDHDALFPVMTPKKPQFSAFSAGTPAPLPPIVTPMIPSQTWQGATSNKVMLDQKLPDRVEARPYNNTADFIGPYTATHRN